MWFIISFLHKGIAITSLIKTLSSALSLINKFLGSMRSWIHWDSPKCVDRIHWHSAKFWWCPRAAASVQYQCRLLRTENYYGHVVQWLELKVALTGLVNTPQGKTCYIFSDSWLGRSYNKKWKTPHVGLQIMETIMQLIRLFG